MSIRFLADECLVDAIIQGLRSREPAIDILDVKAAGLRATSDPALLELAARENRILITHDRGTMPRHFFERIAAGQLNNPGLLVVRRESAIGSTIEYLVLIWAASQAEEWRDRVEYLPL